MRMSLFTTVTTTLLALFMLFVGVACAQTNNPMRPTTPGDITPPIGNQQIPSPGIQCTPPEILINGQCVDPSQGITPGGSQGNQGGGQGFNPGSNVGGPGSGAGSNYGAGSGLGNCPAGQIFVNGQCVNIGGGGQGGQQGPGGPGQGGQQGPGGPGQGGQQGPGGPGQGGQQGPGGPGQGGQQGPGGGRQAQCQAVYQQCLAHCQPLQAANPAGYNQCVHDCNVGMTNCMQ